MQITSDTIIAFLALIVSIVTYFFSKYSFRETKRMLQYQINIDMVSITEAYIKENPQLLQLHNIVIEDVLNDGITEFEFFYILNSLRASEAFYIIKNKKKLPSEYRKIFLNNEKVKNLYINYLRGNFFSQSPFTEMLDEFYGFHNLKRS